MGVKQTWQRKLVIHCSADLSLHTILLSKKRLSIYNTYSLIVNIVTWITLKNNRTKSITHKKNFELFIKIINDENFRNAVFSEFKVNPPVNNIRAEASSFRPDVS